MRNAGAAAMMSVGCVQVGCSDRQALPESGCLEWRVPVQTDEVSEARFMEKSGVREVTVVEGDRAVPGELEIFVERVLTYDVESDAPLHCIERYPEHRVDSWWALRVAQVETSWRSSHPTPFEQSHLMVSDFVEVASDDPAMDGLEVFASATRGDAQDQGRLTRDDGTVLMSWESLGSGG